MVHIGIIPDGNRRWCKNNNLLLNSLGSIWIDKLKNIVNELQTKKYKYLMEVDEISLYLCSIDNMDRTDETINLIYEFMRKLWHIKKQPKYEDVVNKYLCDIKINIIGEVNKLPNDIQEICKELELINKNSKYILNIAMAYDYNKDIINHGVNENPNYNRIQSNIDLIIRSGGEKRLSGFFPTKIMYSELFFEKKLWPDMNLQRINKIIKLYKQRNRRFGI